MAAVLSNPRRVELIRLGDEGPFRLSLPHAFGVIVEYFPTSDAALKRLVELECLLDKAQGLVERER